MAYLWCDNSDHISTWQSGLAAATPLYLDTEFMRERTFWPQLALVQVHDGEQIRLIDTTQVNGPTLSPLFQQHPLVMHACSEDLEAIAAFTGDYPAVIEDTQIAAALTGEDMQLGYQKVVQMLLGVELPKGATRTNWLKRPLSQEQLLYAEDDVKYLPEVTDILRDRLVNLGRESWWREECQRLLQQARTVTAPEKAWRNVKGAGLLQGQALAVLAVLGDALSEAEREGWSYVGYKGGSEAGVRNLSWLLRDGDGRWYMLAISQMDPASEIDTTALLMIAKRILTLKE